MRLRKNDTNNNKTFGVFGVAATQIEFVQKNLFPHLPHFICTYIFDVFDASCEVCERRNTDEQNANGV